MLKVGDKVRVREDLIACSYYGGEMFCSGYMESLKGRIATIVEAYDLFYDIDIDREGWMWSEEMFEKIEEKESNNMKELTFREVIANIKEGEVWECSTEADWNIKAIKCEKGEIEISFKEVTKGYCFDLNVRFKLKKPQYTFQEAFKAFEEGKEIESCVSSEVYKGKEEYRNPYLLSPREIRGQWYIND